MRAMRCDQCRAEVELANKYTEPADWFVVVHGAEDEITLCSIGCLATWAAMQSIAQEAP